MELSDRIETLRHESLKHVAEFGLHHVSRSLLGRKAIEAYSTCFAGRVEDPALNAETGGIEFENPLTVAAGWDKKGWAVNGLYDLGFAGVEVGTVPLLGQPGNPKPRMSMVDRRNGVGLNAMGFNSSGAEAVGRNLDAEVPIRGRIGINIGLNKVMPHEQAPWAHAAAIPYLYKHADYFVFNPASPNTPGLRELQKQVALRACIKAMQEAMEEQGGQKPLYVKLAPDTTPDMLHEAIEASAEEGVTGLVLANTTLNEFIKRMHGVEGKPGGISGNNALYRTVVLRMVYEAYEQAGDKLDIIGVGGISNAEHALEFMMAGASMIQVLTAIRPQLGRTATKINRDLLAWMDDHKIDNVKQLVGMATHRGAKYPQAA